MRRIAYVSIASALIAVFLTFNVLAMPYNPGYFTSVDQFSELLPSGVKQSKVSETARPRGNFFMSADLTIINKGNGKIGALAVALMAIPVDEAYITVYLDRWDEKEERWRQVKYYEAEFYAKDYPDGLSTPKVDISFVDQPKGYYYRLRGAFGALLNNEYEGFNPVTDGILLD